MWVVEAHSESETDLRGRSFTSGDIEIISGLEIIRGCASSSRGIFRKFWANNSIFGKILYLTSKLNISPFTIWVGGYYWDSPNIMFILKDPSRVERLVIRCSSEAWNYKTRLPLTRQLCPGTVLINDRNIKNRARADSRRRRGNNCGENYPYNKFDIVRLEVQIDLPLQHNVPLVGSLLGGGRPG